MFGIMVSHPPSYVGAHRGRMPATVFDTEARTYESIW